MEGSGWEGQNFALRVVEPLLRRRFIAFSWKITCIIPKILSFVLTYGAPLNDIQKLFPTSQKTVFINVYLTLFMEIMSECYENHFETSVNTARGSVVSDKLESTLIAFIGCDKVKRPYNSNKMGYIVCSCFVRRLMLYVPCIMSVSPYINLHLMRHAMYRLNHVLATSLMRFGVYRHHP